MIIVLNLLQTLIWVTFSPFTKFYLRQCIKGKAILIKLF